MRDRNRQRSCFPSPTTSITTTSLRPVCCPTWSFWAQGSEDSSDLGICDCFLSPKGSLSQIHKEGNAMERGKMER